MPNAEHRFRCLKLNIIPNRGQYLSLKICLAIVEVKYVWLACQGYAAVWLYQASNMQVKLCIYLPSLVACPTISVYLILTLSENCAT